MSDTDRALRELIVLSVASALFLTAVVMAMVGLATLEDPRS